MKKIALIAAGVFFIACLTASAQTDQQQGMQMGMKNHGMMRGNMGGMDQGMMVGCAPMQRSMTMVNLLPEMDEQLSLSQDQSEQLIDLRSDFKKQQADFQAEMTKQGKKLQALVNESAPVDEVRDQMKAWADTRIDMHSAAYQTEQEMKALLTDEQNAKLEVIMEEHDDMMKKGMPKSRGGKRK
ncbi:MAG: Spy/CpxP family protein refolding chaperone [Desulfosalsimonas sp.]|uniref:Spy/CpxP family protein refolding chaperone n=1 Tax=Desulfosalsimonas sp. TaxID=3073848 RepID=UPI0039710E3C